MKEHKALLKLGLPITVAQLGLTLQNLADNVMVGRHSTEELAAAGLVNNLFVLAILLTLGFSIGAVSQFGSLYTQNKKERIVEILKSSIVANSLQGMVIVALLVGLYFVLPYMGQPDELLPLMRPYLVIQICSMPFFFLSAAFRQMTDSINDTVVDMTVILIANAWNIFFNWVFIYGNLGAPELGLMGAAWATFTSRLIIFVLYLCVFFFRPKYKVYVQYWKTARIHIDDVKLLNRLGWPIAIQMGMETASFSLTAIMIGWLGTNVLAAHQVMINVANAVFLTYVGISNAVSIRVSNHNGLHNMVGVKQAAFAGWQIILCFGLVLGTTAFFFCTEISRLFTDSEEVSLIVGSLAIPFLLYQFGDGMQCTFSNALRGLGDVKKLMQYSFLAYVVISLPLSYLLGIVCGWGATGIWMGFPFGLTTAGILYLRRFRSLCRKTAISNQSSAINRQ